MKHLLLVLIGGLTLFSCQSKKKVVEDQNLPVDIRYKEDWYLYTNNLNTEDYEEAKIKLLEQIKTMASEQPCENTGDWMYSPMGITLCGYAEGYIAYPKSMEKNIKSLISRYNSLLTSEYNKLGLATPDKKDCPPPSKRPLAVRCEDGKTVLVFDETEEQ